MNISQVLKFDGPIDSLIWKHPIEDFNTTTQLIVDETHEALLVLNGNACDLFGPGRHTLESANIPIAKRIINIPTDGQTPFPCKVFFINKVHQMDMTWGIPGEITLNDPVYDIFLHVGLCGNLNMVVNDSRKFLLKIVGFRASFNGEELVAKFRGIIKQYVKAYVSKIMNVGKVSFFDMNENLFDISEVVKEQLIPIFDDYGVEILQFNIEAINVPDEDYESVKRAKEGRTSRMIQGYTWQEERQMQVAEKFAGNEGTMGNIGGAVGGFMVGGAFGGNIASLARNALSPDSIPTEKPIKDLRNIASPVDVQELTSTIGKEQNVQEQPINNETSSVTSNEEIKFCTGCGNQLTSDMLFCPKCGTKQAKVCPNCQTPLMEDAMFCHKCGTKC